MDEPEHVAELAQRTLEANEAHLHVLETYVQTLEAELEKLDGLLDAIDESDVDLGCFVTIPGSVRATAPVATKEFISPDSPFYVDALRRNRYQNMTEARSMKPRELEMLAEAVQADGHRRRALSVQKSGSLASLSMGAHPELGDRDTDWERVAEKVSAISATTRTARECEIRWLGDRHPELNHEPWSHEEEVRVRSLAAEYADGQPDWVDIAERLGTKRTPLDCMRHAIPRKSHQWTTEADERLLEAICMYGHDNWHLVARYVSEDTTPSQCSSRFQKTLDPSIKRTTWTPGEDARLSAAVAAYGTSWVDVAANVPGRHNDQCRERWFEHVNPGVNKGQWTEEEDRVLVDYVRGHKNASWKQVSEHVRNGRTESMCRNRHAVLQRGPNIIPANATMNSEAQSARDGQEAESSTANVNAIRFKPPLPSLDTTSTQTNVKYDRPNRVVFLEPVVSSNPEWHKHRNVHATRHKARSTKTSKKRKLELPSEEIGERHAG